MKRFGKYRKKNYLNRSLFVLEDSTILSLRLSNKRVRNKIIKKFYNDELININVEID